MAPLAPWTTSLGGAGAGGGRHEITHASAAFLLPSCLAHAQAPPLPTVPQTLGRGQASADTPGSLCVAGVGVGCKNTLAWRLMPTSDLVLNARPIAHVPRGLGRSPRLFQTLQNACERIAFTWSALPCLSLTGLSPRVTSTGLPGHPPCLLIPHRRVHCISFNLFVRIYNFVSCCLVIWLLFLSPVR